jgi:phage terminase large subunit
MILTLSDIITLRPQQSPLYDAYFNQGIRNMIHLAHRRFGKGMGMFNMMLAAALHTRGIYGYFLPTIGQSRRVIWQTICSDGKRLIHRYPEQLVPLENIHNTEQVITTSNGSICYVSGSDNYKRFIGMDFRYLVWDEFQDSNPEAVHAFRPMLTRNKGFQVFVGTPRAYNHLGELYHAHKDDKSWYVTNLTIDDTVDEFGKRIITEEDIELERANGMPEELILQEYYGSFDAAIRGAYFSEGLQQARKDGRIGHFPANPNYPVYTGWDLGFDDSMSIWLVQVYDGKIFLIDYIEDRGKGMAPYIALLRERTDNVGLYRTIDYAPHDIEVHELMPGKTRKDQAREMGIMFRTVARPAKKMHAIQVIRHMFPRFHFNESAVKKGLKHLSEYRPQYDEKNGVYSLDPLRNAATHGADALQTFCLGWMTQFENQGLKRQFEIANLYGQMMY